jgi:hypothetical protein
MAAAVIGCLVVGLASAGCSSTDNQPKGAGGSAGSGGSGGQAGGTSDAGPRDPNLNCVKPGTASNEKGVGGYCESNADCVSGGGGFIVCSNFVETTPRYSWFCTTLCSVDADCGTGAFCGHSDLGNGCVPNACGARPDGGPDAPADGGDASMDVVTESTPDAAPDVAAEGSSDATPEATPDVAADTVSDAPSEAASSDAADGTTD